MFYQFLNNRHSLFLLLNCAVLHSIQQMRTMAGSCIIRRASHIYKQIPLIRIVLPKIVCVFNDPIHRRIVSSDKISICIVLRIHISAFVNVPEDSLDTLLSTSLLQNRPLLSTSITEPFAQIYYISPSISPQLDSSTPAKNCASVQGTNAQFVKSAGSEVIPPAPLSIFPVPVFRSGIHNCG